MSRTIRRKNERWEEYWFVDAWYNNYDHEVRAVNVDYTKECKKRLADYHSDKYNFHAPKDFRKSCQRDFRAKNRAILERAIRTNNDEPMFIPFIKNADWNYF
jgi:hypothetical protein